MLPLEEGETYCFAALRLSRSVSRSVGPPNDSLQFLRLVAHIEMQFGLQIYHNTI